MASDRPTGGAHGWLKSAVGRATGSELRTRKSLIRLDFIEHKSERSVMPQDTGVGRNVVLDGLDFASLRRVWEQTFGATPPSSLSRVFLHRVLAYERQCRTHGGHSATTRRILAAMANETPSSGAPAESVSAGCAFYLFIRVMEITDILSQNVPLEDVQYLAGHSNPSGHTDL